MCERYLPIFEAKWPGVPWPRQLLGDVDVWHRTRARGLPDAPADADSAYAAYHRCFDFLLCAYHYKDEPVYLAADTSGAIAHAAYTRAEHVWLADDVAAARIEREWSAHYAIEEECRPSEPPHFEQLYKPEHRRHDNVAFTAVYRREWAIIAAWLRAEAVWQYPEPSELDEMMRGLKSWEAYQFELMGPSLSEPESTSDGRT